MLKLTFCLALSLILGLFVQQCSAQSSSDQPQSATAASPSLVIELFRHGARAPLEDTYAPDWYSYQLGELTTIGQREHYLLGTALAQNYPSILGQPYNLSKIYFRSSVLARSLESANAQLYGVYQGKGPALNANSSYPSQRAFPPFNQTQLEQLNQGLNNSQAIPGGYIPIAANTTTDENGIELLEPTQVCFNLLNDILENVLGEEALNFWNNDLASTRQQLKNIGYDLGNPYDLGTFGDALVCDYYDGRQLPGDIDPSSELYLNVTFARNWFFTKALWGTPEQRQLLSVPLFNYILTYLDRKQENTTNFEFMFLSTAETNLIDMLATLNILTADCLMANYKAQIAGQALPYPNCNYTEFASNIIVEFYQNSTASSIIFKYNDVAMPLCNNQTECSYEDFKTLVNQSTNGFTPQKYQTDCLGRSLPELQKILKNLGTAFQGANTGGDTQGKLDSIFNNFTHVLEIVEGGNPDDNSVDNGENIFENVKNDIKNDIKDHITNGLDNLFGNH